MSTTACEKLTPEKVRKQRRVILYGMQLAEKKYEKDRKRWLRLDRELKARCPHKTMSGGSYSRWCTDCGEDWDTT